MDDKCKNCGATSFSKVDGYLICNYCDIKISNREKSQEVSISINEDIERLMKMIEDDPLNSRRYVNLILDIDPSNQKVLKFLE